MNDQEYIDSINNSIYISKNSKTTYVNNMKTLLKHCKADTIHELLTHPVKYGACITDLDKPLNTKFSYLVAVLAFLKYSGLKEDDSDTFHAWYTFYLKTRNTVDDIVGNHEQTERQKQAHVSWDAIIQARDELAQNKYTFANLEHLLLAMYTYMPPRRQMDYAILQIYTDPNVDPSHDHNFIHLYSHKYKSPYIVIANFKTAKYYNKPFFNKEIPAELIDIIKYSIKLEPRDHVFTQKSKEPYNSTDCFQKSCNRILKKMFNDYTTLNTLRHSYAMHLNTLNLTIKQRDREAFKMGHNLRKNFEYAHRPAS